MMLVNITATTFPEFLLGIAALTVMLSDLFFSRRIENIAYYLTQFFLVVATSLLLKSIIYSKIHGVQLPLDGLHYFLKLSIFLISSLLFIYSKNYIKNRRLPIGEFYVLSLISILGATVLISASNLLTIYIGLELLSLPIYALLAAYHTGSTGVEASIKYFLLGAVSSAFLLYGMSFIYGVTGNLGLSEISNYLKNPEMLQSEIVILGMILMIATAAFKLGAVPFHMWVPDVYQGTSHAVIAFFASVTKIPVFSMILNILIISMPAQSGIWIKLITSLAVLSIFLGNFMALTQNNVKRMVGYSTISQTGFLLLTITLSQELTTTIAFFYIISSLLSVSIFFGVLVILSSRTDEDGFQNLSDLSGLGFYYPLIALIMLAAVLSMVGLPPLIGFMAKFFIINDLINHGRYELGIYCLIMSVISSVYYMRLIQYIYFSKPLETKGIDLISSGKKLPVSSLSIKAFLILLFGLFPSLILGLFNLNLS